MSLSRKPAKNNTSFWDNRRGVIRTRKGGWIPGEIVHCHGYDMMEDLVGRVSYFQVMILNITGRLPERPLADWMEAYFICNSYPDARIWCNQIGSLAGTTRSSPPVAAGAGILASDSKMYGPGTALAGIDFFVKAVNNKRRGMSVEDIVKSCQRNPKSKPVIIGYARPVAKGDERIEALERVRTKLGFERGEHLTLAFDLDKIMREKTGESMNLLAYVLPFLCDQGYTAREIDRMLSTIVYSGVLACYAEAADQPPEAFFPLQCEDVDYQGPPPREVS